MKCPIRDMHPCKESECAIWDIRRKCCGFITQPPINCEELIYWMEDKLYKLNEQRHD